MEDPKKQLIDRLKQAQNVLVTVSKNPSVDQLSAAIGLTIALNNMGKHATAVFSGQVPSTIEFLKPEETLEQNTDSLRDFIIALDKSKADKLRYKVEDNVVRIFITPYKTSVSQADLEFSQGDFNVDVVIGLGVESQQDLDDAIQAHGRILHDALVASVTVDQPSELGTINIVGNNVSSLSEMAAGIAGELDKKAIDDAQVATAFLTGIVAVTDRFSNEHTTAETMSVSATLMSAGANQQLISNELAAPVTVETPKSEEPDETHEDKPEAQPQEPPKSDDGTLEIDHEHDAEKTAEPSETHEPSEQPEGNEGEAGEPSQPEAVLPPPNDEQSEVSVPTDAAPENTPDDPAQHTDEAKQGDATGSQPDGVNDQHQPPTQVEGEATGHQNSSDDLFLPQPEESVSSGVSSTTVSTRGRTIEPPSMGGTLTANTAQEPLGESFDKISEHKDEQQPPMLTHQSPLQPTPAAVSSSESQPSQPSAQHDLPSQAASGAQTTAPADLPAPEPTPAPAQPAVPEAIEKQVATLPEAKASASTPPAQEENNADEARKAVEAAFNQAGSDSGPLEPITALNAQPLGDPLHGSEASAQQSPVPPSDAAAQTPITQQNQAAPAPFVPAPGFGASASPSAFPGVVPGAAVEDDPNPPPPVPPPMIPQIP